MKIQIIYSSLSGKTKRLAEYLYREPGEEEITIHDLAEGTPEPNGDILLLGYHGRPPHRSRDGAGSRALQGKD